MYIFYLYNIALGFGKLKIFKGFHQNVVLYNQTFWMLKIIPILNLAK